jgi:coenzyme PQQ precursor peptide PqqA
MMACGLCAAARIRYRGAGHNQGEPTMRWETPQAIDFRFGMEITLYIARR